MPIESPRRPITVAVVGATGLVGRTIIQILAERHFPVAELRPLASRADGRSVELVLGEPRLKRVMADADRAGARNVYLLGPDEVARGEVLIRDLSSGEQRSEPIPE